MAFTSLVVLVFFASVVSPIIASLRKMKAKKVELTYIQASSEIQAMLL
jgi:hypothetical protein